MDEIGRLCAQLLNKLEPYRVGSAKARTRLKRKHGAKLAKLAWLLHKLEGVNVVDMSTSATVSLAKGERRNEIARLCLQVYETLEPYRNADEVTRTALVAKHGQILGDLAMLANILAEPDLDRRERKLYIGYYWAEPYTEVIFDFFTKHSRLKRSAPD